MRRLAPALALLAAPAAAGELVVAVRGIPAEPGTLMVAACAPESFPNGQCRFLARAPAKPGEVTVSFTGVPEGRWALKAFLDRDGDLKLGTDWLGRPTEPVAFGNDAPIGRLGPPAFEAASVAVPATGRVQSTLTLRTKE